jgi:hypothetical protein
MDEEHKMNTIRYSVIHAQFPFLFLCVHVYACILIRFTNTRKRFWRPYCIELEQEECMLSKDPHAVCKCKPLSALDSKGNKKKNKKKGISALKQKKPMVYKEEEKSHREGPEHPMHSWVRMWD